MRQGAGVAAALGLPIIKSPKDLNQSYLPLDPVDETWVFDMPYTIECISSALVIRRVQRMSAESKSKNTAGVSLGRANT